MGDGQNDAGGRPSHRHAAHLRASHQDKVELHERRLWRTARQLVLDHGEAAQMEAANRRSLLSLFLDIGAARNSGSPSRSFTGMGSAQI
jgi:hypothetical protein